MVRWLVRLVRRRLGGGGVNVNLDTSCGFPCQILILRSRSQGGIDYLVVDVDDVIVQMAWCLDNWGWVTDMLNVHGTATAHGWSRIDWRKEGSCFGVCFSAVLLCSGRAEDGTLFMDWYG